MYPTDIKDIHKGDILYESEYGSTVEIEVLENPTSNHEENYWVFPGRTQKRGVINFRGEIEGGAYNPDLRKGDRSLHEAYGSNFEKLELLHTVGVEDAA